MSIWGHTPITPDVILRPINPQRPVWEILKLLFLFIGLPGFVLSANSILIQAWVWACGYLIFILTTYFLLTRVIHNTDIENDNSGIQEILPKTRATPRIHQFMWVGLSAAASILPT